MLKKQLVTMALASTLTVGVTAAQGYQHAPSKKEMTFSGIVESVNMKDQSFVVRNDDRGNVEELKFHVAPGTRLTLDGTPVLLSELQRDDQVTVSYETVHTVKNVHRKKVT